MSDKPREFWIAVKSNGDFSAHEFPCVDMSGYYGAVHVIEYSHVQRLEADLKMLRDLYNGKESVADELLKANKRIEKLREALKGYDCGCTTPLGPIDICGEMYCGLIAQKALKADSLAEQEGKV